MQEEQLVNPEASAEDQALLTEIRDRYKSWSDKWRAAREERRTDMRYVLGDPWDPADKKARADDGRPCINHDELNQYVNEALGNLRAAKRGIKVEPSGNGASDETAEFRQNLIRGIEYKSQAQGTYLNCYQALLEGGYSFFRLDREYANQDEDGPDDQHICVAAIPNPDSVLYDPDCKKADWSDPRAVFVLDPLPEDEFKRQYPDREVRDFSDEDRRIAKDWIGEKTVLVAEYWRVEVKRVRNKRNTRWIEKKTVVQYITNGIEILERNPQPGPHIAIVPMIGIEKWTDEGSGPVRKINSMVRLARDPQMSLAYLVSQQMEEAGLSPKTPYIGYVGQFETDKEAWDTATKKPHAYLQVDPMPDGAAGVLPLPQRVPFTPNIQAFEMGKDSARRAIQAAMGVTPLPTAAQRNNEKSGVALEKIRQQQAIGTLTFVDKFEAALAYAGRIIDSWIPTVYDTERQVGLRLPDDSHKVVTINTRAPYVDPKTQKPEHYPVGEGDHDVTISAGPSDNSQREAAGEFLDTLISNLGNLPVAPPQAAKLLSLAIRMKQLGPKGDQMAEIISPDDQGQPEIPPQIQQAVAQLQQELQAINAYAQQVEREKEELQQKLDAKVVDNEYRLKIEQMKIEADIAKAEIATKSQNLEERLKFVEDAWKQLHGQQHEEVMAQADQAHQQMQQRSQQDHEQQMAERQAQVTQAQQLQQQSHEQQMAQQQQEQEPDKAA